MAVQVRSSSLSPIITPKVFVNPINVQQMILVNAPTNKNGRRRPNRLVQVSLNTPTVGATRMPVTGPMI